MNDKYKIFPLKYSKNLNLVKMVDDNLIKTYKNVIDSFPDFLTLLLNEKTEFYLTIKDLQISCQEIENSFMFSYVNIQDYFKISINIELFDENDLKNYEQIVLFNLVKSNTRITPDPLKIYIEEENGKYNFINSNFGGDVEIEYYVYIEKQNNNYFLVSVKYVNEQEVSVDTLPIRYEELIKYVNTKDDYGYQI